jgi:hypothetical protein
MNNSFALSERDFRTTQSIRVSKFSRFGRFNSLHDRAPLFVKPQMGLPANKPLAFPVITLIIRATSSYSNGDQDFRGQPSEYASCGSKALMRSADGPFNRT